ncbi:hypothetical protein F5Y16DRAFT_410698 [Xylariaceae sp. FL0255]|nr:hypothetical protein F5Y16DRAFT_410698 [Xylariaceae sp. FL0255]
MSASSSTPSTSTALKVLMAILMIDAAIEFSLLSATVAWLNQFVSVNTFKFIFAGATHEISGAPKNLLVNQGHTSNAAAGTAFIVIGLGGILALFLRSRSHGGLTGFSKFLYYLWMSLQIPALLLTLIALAYVFYETNARVGQTIDASAAAALGAGAAYPLKSWTPQNWFAALLDLDLASAAARDAILAHLEIARGWEYNLIPLFLIQIGETVAAIMDYLAFRRSSKVAAAPYNSLIRDNYS